MARVIIVGAGVSGLATAAFLDGSGHDIQVIESQPEPGGLVRSDRTDGRVCDRAANGWLDNEPAIERLIERVGLTDQILPVNDKFKARYIFADGKMMAAPLSLAAMISTPLLTPWAKLRLLGEPLVGRASPDADETIAEFLGRRLGPRFVDRMVAPMVAGVYAARPEQIAVRAAFPRLWQLEQEHGGLLLGALRSRRSGARRGRLTTLKHGAGQLNRTIRDQLGERLVTGEPVQAVEKRRYGWMVHTAGGAQPADAVVLACPAWAQASIVRSLDADLAAVLNEIPYSPVAVVVTAWPSGTWDRHPNGFGVLIAPGEDVGGMMGTLFTSSIFPSHANRDEILLRSIFGGAIHPEVVQLDDQQLLARCRAGLGRFFGQEHSAPKMVKVYRHTRGIPQYTTGHTSRTRAIQAAQSKHGGLFFTGNHIEGVGVKDCARNGEKTAEAVTSWLDSA